LKLTCAEKRSLRQESYARRWCRAEYLQNPNNTNNAIGARLPCARLGFAQALLTTAEQDASNVTRQIDSTVLPLVSARGKAHRQESTPVLYNFEICVAH
jgi:hypothetical protein